MCTTLIAKWSFEQDPVLENPSSVFWGDGRTATLRDYEHHRSDTRELVETPDGALELRMYPGIVAYVCYDGYQRLWFVVPPDGEPLSLDLSEPDATDAEITSALADLPILYRAVIHRSSGRTKAK
jgi:hypothetical protein